MEEDTAQTFDRATLEAKPLKNDQETPRENDRPETNTRGDTTNILQRLRDSRLNIGEIFGPPTPSKGIPRPTKSTLSIPTKIEHPQGSARWAARELEKAETLMEKWKIVDQIVITNPQELETALKILNGRPAEEAESLQSRIAVFGGEGVTIPIQDTARVLRASRAPIVQRLLISRLEKTLAPSRELLFEILGGLKNAHVSTDLAISILTYFGQELRSATPVPGEANLSAQTLINGITGNFGMKVQQELGFADRLRADAQPERNLANALKLAVCMQDPKAIALTFTRLGVEIGPISPEGGKIS